MPRHSDADDVTMYRARYTLIYPVRDGEVESRTYTQFFGPYRGSGPAKSAIRHETRSRGVEYYEREGIKVETEIEVADITWRPYHG